MDIIGLILLLGVGAVVAMYIYIQTHGGPDAH